MIEFSILCLERFGKGGDLGRILPLVDSLHLDIMDGEFVKNTASTVSEINQFNSGLKKNVHILAYHPEKYIKELQGVASISFHIEAAKDPGSIVEMIQDQGFGAGICINPETPVSVLEPYLDQIDRVVVMAVVPGFASQKYLPETSKKVSAIRVMNPNIEIVVDGGMNEETIHEVMTLGANTCVVCSVIVKSQDYKAKIQELKSAGVTGSENWAEKNNLIKTSNQ